MLRLTRTGECDACSILQVLERGGWRVERTYTVLGLTYRTFRRGYAECSLLTLERSSSTSISLRPRHEWWHIWQDANLLSSSLRAGGIYIKRIQFASLVIMMRTSVSLSRGSSTARTTARDRIALSKLRLPTGSD